MKGGGEAYDAFAYAYDAALGEPFFAVLREHLDRLTNGLSLSGKRHLDLACGTGLVAQYFAGRGARTVGLDASLPMLHFARKRHTPVIASDMRALALRGRFDLITSFYDSLNHLLSKDDLTIAFRNVRNVLAAGGSFWFDMNHPRAYTEVWSIDEPFESEGADYRLEIATSFDRKTKIATGEVRGHRAMGDERVEIGEVHQQRSYTEREVESALKAAGLRVTERFYFNPFDPNETRLQMKMFFRVEVA